MKQSTNLHTYLKSNLPTCSVTLDTKSRNDGDVLEINDPTKKYYIAFLLNRKGKDRKYPEDEYLVCIKTAFEDKGVPV